MKIPTMTEAEIAQVLGDDRAVLLGDFAALEGIAALECQTAAADAARRCRVCGCTWETTCIDRFGRACHWVAWDLCSACNGTNRTEGRAR